MIDHDRQADDSGGGDHAEPPDPAVFPAVERTAALAESVAESLRSMVIRGILKPGERIVERSLCLTLGVSRTPMREALKLLHQDGLVEITRNCGARVAAYDANDALHLFEVISTLEGLAAARFARHASQQARQDLEDLHARMLDLYAGGKLDQYFEVNSAIHDLIISACGNPVLLDGHSRLMLLVRRGRYMAIMDAARWHQAVREHEALMSAIRAGYDQAADLIWRQHLHNTGLAVSEALQATDPATLPDRVRAT